MSIVLVVEDNVHLSRLYAKAIAIHDVVVLQAAKLVQAEEILEAVTPEVVILDLGMPNGGGLALLDYLKEQDRFDRTKIIVASGDYNYQREVESRGIEAFLTKPVSVSTLKLIVENIVVGAPRIPPKN